MNRAYEVTAPMKLQPEMRQCSREELRNQTIFRADRNLAMDTGRSKHLELTLPLGLLSGYNSHEGAPQCAASMWRNSKTA
jgi:hypothetical protein